MPACLISVSSIFKNLTRHLSTPCTLSFSLSRSIPFFQRLFARASGLRGSPRSLLYCARSFMHLPRVFVCRAKFRLFSSLPEKGKVLFFLNRTIMRGSFLKCTPILEFFLCVRGVNKRARQNRYTEIIYLVEL